MRLWSLHPQYLDAKGLVALWREALLAQKVLQGNTRGYRNHPQLERFKQQKNPLAAITVYLRVIHNEAVARGYNFNAKKILSYRGTKQITVTSGQLKYEWKHLKRKLRVRNIVMYRALQKTQQPLPHPLFSLIDGNVETWEVQK